MKELIKPNVVENAYELVNINCTEQDIRNCGGLECICRGNDNESITTEDEILF